MQGLGYAIVVGYGTLFVVLTLLFTFFDRKFGGTKNTSEEFNTAGRSIKTGLVAVDVVSRWTWFGSGAAIQLFLFGILALELKHKAPMAHTVIELVHLRWGKLASFVYLYLIYLNNVIVSTILFIGAGEVLTAITGMNIYAPLLLLPLGVVIYTFGGGLKATFTSSYIHTIIIFVTLNILVYAVYNPDSKYQVVVQNLTPLQVYASSKEPIGSISKVWDNLNLSSSVAPVPDNKGGRYLTMFSKGGLQFGVWNVLASFGSVCVDQAYWQGAIAASPKGAFRGYVLGGLLWFPIPFTFATAIGLAAKAIDLPISTDEFNQGLISLATAHYLLGTGGVVLMLTAVFMSVTSAGSSEFMSMSSLWTYDVYQRYINPKATKTQLLQVSRMSVVIFGLLMAATSCLFKAVGIDVNFLFFVGGFLVSSAFPPLVLMVVWRAMPAGAAIAGAMGGQVLSITAWLVHTQVLYRRMTVNDTLQRLGPTLDGTAVSVFSSALICVVWTLIAPEKGNSFARWQAIEAVDDVKVPDTPKDYLEQKDVLLNRYSLFAITLCVIILILWPILTLPAGVFLKGYFTFWVILSIMWAIIASVVATFLPLFEARESIMRIMKGVLGFNVGQSGSVVGNALPVSSPVDASRSNDMN